MRYDFAGREWDALGKRPAMVTLTYPADWRAFAPDAREVVRQREAFKEAWRRKWGAPVGVWVMEFQPRLRRAEHERHAPHIHMYLGLPDAVSDEEYAGLVRRTYRRKKLEREYGRYEGRARLDPIEGEFSEWLLVTWARIVGSDGAHRKRGADITPAFWTEDAEAKADRTAIAEYFWMESGKWGQKDPPEGFGGLSFYGAWGEGQGFVIRETEEEVHSRVWYEERRMYRKLIQARTREWKGGRVGRRRGASRNGVTAFLRCAPELADRITRAAEESVAWKAARA